MVVLEQRPAAFSCSAGLLTMSGEDNPEPRTSPAKSDFDMNDLFGFNDSEAGSGGLEGAKRQYLDEFHR